MITFFITFFLQRIMDLFFQIAILSSSFYTATVFFGQKNLHKFFDLFLLVMLQVIHNLFFHNFFSIKNFGFIFFDCNSVKLLSYRYCVIFRTKKIHQFFEKSHHHHHHHLFLNILTKYCSKKEKYIYVCCYFYIS